MNSREEEEWCINHIAVGSLCIQIGSRVAPENKTSKDEKF